MSAIQRPKKSAKLPKLTIQQAIENEEVVERMNRKIAFAKNERHLVTALSYANALAQTKGTVHLQDATEQLFATSKPKLMAFRAQPVAVVFGLYEQGRIYQTELKLINTTRHIQRLKLTPFYLGEFSLAQIKYPQQSSGDVAPGMAVVVSIRFRPSAHADFTDKLIAILSDGVLEVPVLAQLESCRLDWPAQIQCGHGWVGNVLKQRITAQNQGGIGHFRLKGAPLEATEMMLGFFKVLPCEFHVGAKEKAFLQIQFEANQAGQFEQTLQIESLQGAKENKFIHLRGSSYTAELTLTQINGQKLQEKTVVNNLYFLNCELNQPVHASLKIKNQAVVPVDYLWVFESNDVQISEQTGKFPAAETHEFTFTYHPRVAAPQLIQAKLYLHGLPPQALRKNSVVHKINGLEAIQCLLVNLITKPKQSSLMVLPLHRLIEQPLYPKVSVEESFQIKNMSQAVRTFTVQKVTDSEHCTSHAETTGTIQPGQSAIVPCSFQINYLTPNEQSASYLVHFDNSQSKLISFCGKVTYPALRFNTHHVLFGLCHTYTSNKAFVQLNNDQKNIVRFRVHNGLRFYKLDYYDFYEFQEDDFYKKRLFVIDCETNAQILDWVEVPAGTMKKLEFRLNALAVGQLDGNVQIEVEYGQTTTMVISGRILDVEAELSRDDLNLRQIYKGNVYSSDRFLSKEMFLMNKGQLPIGFEFTLPETDACKLLLSPMKGFLGPKQKQNIKLSIEPIKTGQIDIEIPLNYFDEFKVTPNKFPQLAQKATFLEEEGKRYVSFKSGIRVRAEVKGLDIQYCIKDLSRAQRIRVKPEDAATSVKLSTLSFKSSKTIQAETEKFVFPALEQLVFPNCEINHVSQLHIIIENNSGLTADFEVYADKYRTLQKPIESARLSQTGLIGGEELAFTSEMGQTFLKARKLDRSQKLHLSNNKGISVLCQPTSGSVSKKQSQQITITVFNDASGEFKDQLIISVKDHETKRFPMIFKIKGTPVSLSRNQLSLDFSTPIPSLSLGTFLCNNGLFRRPLKIVNNGPKPVKLQWTVYKLTTVQILIEKKAAAVEDKPQEEKDPVNPSDGTQLEESAPIHQPEYREQLQAILDPEALVSVQPDNRTLSGREQFSFTLVLKNVPSAGQIGYKLVSRAQIVEAQNEQSMEPLQVMVKGIASNLTLVLDTPHENKIHKLERRAIQLAENHTQANSHLIKLRLKNPIQANSSFVVGVQSINCNYDRFLLKGTKTNSNADSIFTQTAKGIVSMVRTAKATQIIKPVQKSFVLESSTYVELQIELVANPQDSKQWQLEEEIRTEGEVTISFTNGEEQRVPLVGWLLRPWISILMPNGQPIGPDNCTLDFGNIHFNNSRKLGIFLSNSSKVDAKWTITYVSLKSNIKYKFEEALWTSQDYEDQKSVDEKKCFRLSQDTGLVLYQSGPVHYMPNTLALPATEDQFTVAHKPARVEFLFKPESNLRYKSRFRLAVEEGPSFDLYVKGVGTLDEQAEKK